ncbi:ABC transporter permease subunit, partial [Streptomyces shenzhenensis]|uniref:ABC transporter permease subunit n=1 Tax=Streptomyces shenzhenensis TaxID=943815 RepID=UPI0038D3FF9D
MVVRRPATGRLGRGRFRRRADTARRRPYEGGPGPAPVLLALGVIWAVFQSLNANFLSPRNLSLLSVDIVGTGLVAVGVVFVLLIGELDLSVGSLAGLSGALFGALNVNHGMPEWLAVLVAVAAGAGAGAFHGFVFTRTGVPAFVVTLAGLLTWDGLMLYLLGPEGSIDFGENGLVAMLTSRHFTAALAGYGLAALG